MATILHINTAFETASVILSRKNTILMELESASQKDHASFLEPSIKKIFAESNLLLRDIDAIAVVNGPGSYTGLRVGLSSAKALCYTLKKQLILLNTLDVMGLALKLQSSFTEHNIMFCPLIDARRMEVFTALYNSELELIQPYSAQILSNNFLKEESKSNIIIAGGNGSIKLEKIIDSKNINYINDLLLSRPIVNLSEESFISGRFNDVAYCEPFYLKPVYFKNVNA